MAFVENGSQPTLFDVNHRALPSKKLYDIANSLVAGLHTVEKVDGDRWVDIVAEIGRSDVEAAVGSLHLNGFKGHIKGPRLTKDTSDNVWVVTTRDIDGKDTLAERSLQYFFGTGTLIGSSVVSRTDIEDPSRIVNVRRTITLKVNRMGDERQASSIDGKDVARWERYYETNGVEHGIRQAVTLTYSKARNHELFQDYSGGGRGLDISSALSPTGNYWESKSGVLYLVAQDLIENYGMDREIVEGFDDSRLPALFQHMWNAQPLKISEPTQ